MVIDSHQHFWQFDPVRDSWINDNMQVIRRDFMPADLKPVLDSNQVAGCVAVQAAQNDAQTHFLLGLAQQNSFIKGVVGWVDLQAGDLADQLAIYEKQSLLKGFRHVVQDEPDDDFMLRPAFLNGVKTIGKHGYTYDILIFPKHIKNAEKLVQLLEDQPFVVDHIAKPYIKEGRIDGWKRDLTRLATYPHVQCKLSGMITEAEWKSWTYEQLVPYIDVAVEAFGTNRLMFGSDWPVCLLAGDYRMMKQVMNRYFVDFSESEREQVFGLNAANFYDLF